MDDLTPYLRDPAAFVDAFVPLNEKGRPWALTAYQRRVLALALRWDADGRLALRLLLWSEPKKSGKTFLAAVLGLWWGFTRPRTEIIVCANDLEQSVGRVFKTMADLCRLNPALGASVTARASQIEVSNGTIILAIASEYRSAAGPRHSLVIFDELWGFGSENAQRLFEELTPPPTEPDAWVLVVSYAGFSGESKLLESLYQRGLAGGRLAEDLEVTQTDELVMFWSHVPRQPWQEDRYYAEQRRLLRPTTFARLHENRWVAPESTFITEAMWDGCVDPEHRPLLPTKDCALFAGVDAGIKHDCAAVVAVTWVGDRLAVACHRIWKPSPADPLDLEATIETFLRELYQRYRLRRVLYDPYQLHRSATALRASGLPMEEFPQTPGNCMAMGNGLFEVLTGRNLTIYPAEDLRTQALGTVAVEGLRGWRVAKERASKKIDAIVALSMAIVAALEDGRSEPPPLPVPGAVENVVRDPEGWPGGGLSYVETYDWLIGRR